jgi:hypothetical protein
MAILSAIRTKMPKRKKNVGYNISELPKIWGQYDRFLLRRKWLDFLKEMWFISVPGAGTNPSDYRVIVGISGSTNADLVVYEIALNEFCNVIYECIFCNALQSLGNFLSNTILKLDENISYNFEELILDPHCKLRFIWT